MQSQSNAKASLRLLFRCSQFCHVSIGSLFVASSLTWSLPGNTTGTLVIPNAPAVTPVAPKAAPVAKPLPKANAPVSKLAAPPAQRKSVIPAPAPQQVVTPSRPSGATPTKLAAPKITRPAPVTVQPTQIRQGLQKNQYIDTTPQKAATSPAPRTPSVVIKSRNNGCQTVVNGGNLQRGCGGTAQPTAPRQATATTAPQRQPVAPRRQRLAAKTPQHAQTSPSPLRPIALKNNPVAIGLPIGSNQVFSLEPIVNRGIEIALAPLPEYSRTTNLYASASPTAMQGSAAQRGTDLMFPVTGESSITSAFGWRIHPITGQGRQHSGTDIGAPMGTPVVAAYSGKVVAAQWAGGYGLMVTLRHVDGTQESRYAHLSEMFVEPGQEVQQGQIIGRVGSTGMSTGPHLHFEWRHLTNEGWVAVDAGPHLQAALNNLIRAQQYAQAVVVQQGS